MFSDFQAVMTSSQGPTMVSMELLLHTDTATISWALTAMALAKLPGTILLGAMFERLQPELLFAVGSAVAGVATAAAPFTTHVWAYVTVMAVTGIGQGFFNTGSCTQGMAK